MKNVHPACVCVIIHSLMFSNESIKPPVKEVKLNSSFVFSPSKYYR